MEIKIVKTRDKKKNEKNFKIPPRVPVNDATNANNNNNNKKKRWKLI